MFLRKRDGGMSYEEILSELKSFPQARLLAVSKKQSSEKILDLYNKGHRLFGENYVQEANEKLKALSHKTDIEWHFIGHLQTNKAKEVVGRFQLIHSVDSLKLAVQISKKCQQEKVQQEILIQINIADEDSKSGLVLSSMTDLQILKIFEDICNLPSLKVKGLMCMPPLDLKEEDSRKYFIKTRELLTKLQQELKTDTHSFSELSMGTSHDYTVALQEGATLIRLGTSVFGQRTY